MAFSVARAGSHARKDVAQGSLSSLAAFPPRRGFGGAASEDFWIRAHADLVSAMRRGKNPHRWKSRRAGPRALRYHAGTNLVLLDPDVRKAFRSERAVNDALRLVIELRKVGSYKRRDYSSNGA